MNLEIVKKQGLPGDIILIEHSGNIFKDPLGVLIGHGQIPQTLDGKPSKYKHAMMITGPDEVAESTIDFKPYQSTKKRMDNGVQYNYLSNYKDSKGKLMHFPFTWDARMLLINEAKRLIEKGYKYPVSGLFGSLLSYWILDKIGIGASNPLQSRRSLYCSAFMQEIVRVLGVLKIYIDFDPKHTARNTSPEMIAQFEMAGLVTWEI